MADTVQQVKDKLNIVEVITPYVKLTKAGRHHKGLSPFTKEKTPSFFVDPERGSYYCFSTGQGGDMFTFIEKMEGVDFKGALKILAEKAGVPLEYTRGRESGTDTRDKLREVMARADALYQSHLALSSALEYAKGRGLTDKTISEWGLGFAPDTWRIALETLTGAENSSGGTFTQNDLLAAGLIKEADGKPGTWYDRFRNRLMFPIRDTAGRTVAFTGRALDSDVPSRDQAKYLNSPETDLYKKSEILFGMDKAKDAIRTRGFAILVEGQFDLVLLHQAGFTNTIALSGTALSPHHLALIKRYADNLMLALDSDRAGLAATAKNAQAALRAGMHVKAVRMPVGKDPADVVSEGPDGVKAFTKLISGAQTVVEFFLAVFSASERDQHKLVMAVEQVVLPLVASVESPMEREHFVGIVARALSSSPDAVRASLRKVVSEAGKSAAPGVGGAPNRPASPTAPASAPRSPMDRRGQELLAIVASYPNSLLAERIKNEYSRIIGAPAFSDVLLEGLDERALFEAGLSYGESPTEFSADELIHVFERAVLTAAHVDATNRLRRAEATRDEAEIAACLTECQELSAKLAHF